MNDSLLRKQLIGFLRGGMAHMTAEEAVKDFPKEKMNTLFPNGTYSAWQLLEHICRTQEDIIDFVTNPQYKEREWPKDYWPDPQKSVTEKEWEKTLSKYRQSLKKLEEIVEKEDLYKKIPWGDGQIILREILLVIDHTSYHIGEFAIMRQTMQTWGKT